MSVSQSRSLGGSGIQTAALAFGGYVTTYQAVTESYDGTSWTEVNDLNTARLGMASAGTQTSALAATGDPGTVVELWNGTNWTETTDVNAAREQIAGVGVDNTAALIFGGFSPSVPGPTGATESWDGSSWTEVNDMNTGRYALSGAGTKTAALAIGGATPPRTGKVESGMDRDWET